MPSSGDNSQRSAPGGDAIHLGHSVHCQRIMDEWKANIDLQKFHDNVKHQRISHFLSIQVALLAVGGLLIKESAGHALAWLALLLPAVVGASLAQAYLGMDLRARAYIDVVKGRLLLLEDEWNGIHPSSPLTTYTDQRLLLSPTSTQPLLREQRLIEYETVRMYGAADTLRAQLEAPVAHIGERRLFRVFVVLWITAAIIAMIIAVSLIAHL